MKHLRERSLRVALYGGSFDPPHIAHVSIVKALREKSFIDEVVVIPTFLNPFKSHSIAPATLRLKWLKEIFHDFKDVTVSSFEVDLKEKIPTFKTVEHFLKSYEKIYLVIGADNLASLNTWYRFEELKERVTFIVASRNKIEIPSEFIQLKIDEEISSSLLRETMDVEKLPKQNAKEIEQYYKEKNAK
jgi:nicotinate-nucleotide adenylyltransferase